MTESIELGDITIAVIRKAIKNVHLTVHPPHGMVTISAPTQTRMEVVRAYAISRLSWIKKQRKQLLDQHREMQKCFVDRESHLIWGRRYLLKVVETSGKQLVKLKHKEIELSVRPGSATEKRQEVMYTWQKQLLHEYIQKTLPIWESKMGVKANAYFIQKMKTKWGSCNPETQNLRFNTELVKKPKELVEYVIVHELAHLISPRHDEVFVSVLDKYYPHWREARLELNDLPLGYVEW